jgi:porphobilinogen deaminase
MRALGGGCSVPIGVWARVKEGHLRVRGSVVSEGFDGSVEIYRLLRLDSLEEGLKAVSVELAAGLGDYCCDR